MNGPTKPLQNKEAAPDDPNQHQGGGENPPGCSVVAFLQRYKSDHRGSRKEKVLFRSFAKGGNAMNSDIKAQIMLLGLKQWQVADEIGITPYTLCAWLRHDRTK